MVNEKVIIAGFGGQGVMLMGQVLSYCATEKEINTLWFPSYGPETRGGTANCSVTISEESVNSPVISTPDSIIIMNKPSLAKFMPKLKKGGNLFVNTNMIMIGAYLEVTKIFTNEEIIEIIKKKFTGSKAALIEINKQALETGRQAVK